jgi:hypothetical protein
MKKVFILLILLFSMVGTAYADCLYNGVYYPTGTRLGPYICQADGTWK